MKLFALYTLFRIKPVILYIKIVIITEININVPYLPYGTMDKRNSGKYF
jgi:hypothetical protein